MLEPAIRDLAKGKNFAALTTLGPTGYPQTQVMWVDADDDHVLINTEIERQKAVNVQRDPRVAVMIWDAENAYKYAEVRGNVVDIVRGDRARAHIDELSRKYLDKDYASPIGSERVILVIEPTRQRSR
ncbi:MAG TPA: TIGR03618 family F420-dependent PPOX class oxidoreductase [Ilumatobacteraceae bacterium]|nr:TIGR03618 family F420-dependent PPOX class oxidoreductase [Ilumatobacteraceae bacterium]